MNKYIVAGSILLVAVFHGEVAAQARPSSHLGMQRIPTHYKCEFFSDYEQAVCSGICGKQGGTWIAHNLPYTDEAGTAQPGKGECQGVE